MSIETILIEDVDNEDYSIPVDDDDYSIPATPPPLPPPLPNFEDSSTAPCDSINNSSASKDTLSKCIDDGMYN